MADNLCKKIGLGYLPEEPSRYDPRVIKKLKLVDGNVPVLREALAEDNLEEVKNMVDQCLYGWLTPLPGFLLSIFPMVSLAQIVASAGLGAFIGYFTNALAIRSLFRPLEPHWYTLGWQGVIPKNRARLADNVATVVGEDLLYREYLVEQIERPALLESLRQLLGGRIGRLCDESPAGVLAWLPAVEVEPLVERVLALLAAWSRTEVSLGPKEALLDVVERQLRALQLGKLVGEEAVEALVRLLDGVLTCDQTQQDLASALEGQALAFLERDVPLQEAVPEELHEALRQGLQQEIPALLDRLAVWLSSADHIEEVNTRLFEALSAYETRAQIERHLFAGIDALLEKSLGTLGGEQGGPLAAKIGQVAATWMTSDRICSQVKTLLLDQYRRRREDPLSELLPDAAWADMRRLLLGLMQLQDGHVAEWGLGRRLGEFMASAGAGGLGARSLRQWLALTATDETALVDWSQRQATELLRREVPVLLDELDIACMVREQVMAFDLLRVEYMVRSLIADQLRYIELLGAVLGAIVGMALPYLNQLL